MEVRSVWKSQEAESAYNGLMEMAVYIRNQIAEPMVPEFPDRYADARRQMDAYMSRAAKLRLMFCMSEITLPNRAVYETEVPACFDMAMTPQES